MKQWRKWLVSILGGMALVAALVIVAPVGSMAGEAPSLTQGTIYVDADALGANDGTSWEDAYTTLQPALDEATAGDQIWVAAGTYLPTYLFDPGNLRSVTFQLKNGVALYGGFDPSVGDTEFGDRDWLANATILSGERGDPGLADNAYHVFYHPAALALDATAVLDGFTVTAGNANALIPNHRGGGMYNNGSSPTVIHCTFTGNSADDGGGMANDYASPIVTDCTFSENSATQDYGGGMFNDHASPSISDCTFAGNEAPDGAGMYNTESSVTVVNSTFTGNSGEKGAGLMNYTNCVVVLTNCTFSGNSASVYGGGIFNGGYNVMSTLTATNCILWGDSPQEIAYTQGSTQQVTYSDVAGTSVYPGTHNIKQDPQFQDPTIGDFHLLPNSPCIDKGNNDAPSLPAFDFEGDPRITDGDGDGMATADMGVDEAPALHTLTLYLGGNGSGAVEQMPDGGLLAHGTVVTLTAIADNHSSFTGWSGDVAGTTNPITFTLDADKVVTATFTLDVHTLGVGYAGNGRGLVSLDPPGGLYDYGTTVTLTAVPDPGSVFTGWSGDAGGTTNPITLTMDADKAITATFITHRVYLPLVAK